MFKNFIDTQALLGPADFDLKRVEVVFGTPNFRNKPSKALWTSTWKESIEQIGWIEWCNWNDFCIEGHNTLYKIYPKKEVKIYEVDNVDDYDSPKLLKAQCSFVTMNPDENPIDYFKMSDLVSGIHFTEKGAALGHHWGDEFRSVLNAIDCESTVWFNTDWVDHIEKICDNAWELLKEVKE